MKETGIIMTGDHPKKILDGTMTMTRRTWGLEVVNQYPDDWEFLRMENDLAVFRLLRKHGGKIVNPRSSAKIIRGTEPNLEFLFQCPYGQVGDRLWVRETYATRTDGIDQILYKADYEAIYKLLKLDEFIERMGYPPVNIKWKPSIHMFRKDSRITLEITELRAERSCQLCPVCPPMFGSDILNSLNAKRGYGWDTNKWVWPIGFTKL